MIIKVDKIRSYQVLCYKNGYRSFRTKEYKDYIEEISSQLDKKEYKGDVAISVHFRCKNETVGDIDNITKPILDILQINGIIENDRKVLKLELEKSFKHNENTIEIIIKEL